MCQAGEQDEAQGVPERPIVLFNQRLSRCVACCMCLQCLKLQVGGLLHVLAVAEATELISQQVPSSPAPQCSGDVGIGLNARRLRESFTNQFLVTYSLRPIGDLGTVFRMYPGLWKVFVEEPELPGRYRLVADQPKRPAGG